MWTLSEATAPLASAVTRIVPELGGVTVQDRAPDVQGVEAVPLSGIHCQLCTVNGNLKGYTLSGVPEAVKVTLMPLVTT